MIANFEHEQQLFWIAFGYFALPLPLKEILNKLKCQ